MVTVLNAHKVDARDIRTVLDQNTKNPSSGELSWDDLIKSIKDALRDQVNTLILKPNETTEKASDIYPLDSLNETALHAVLFYILYPDHKEADTTPQLNYENEYPRADYIRDMFYGLKKTPGKLALILSWLWRDHHDFIDGIYLALGLHEREGHTNGKRSPIRFSYPLLEGNDDNPFHPRRVKYHDRDEEQQQLDEFIVTKPEHNAMNVLLWAVSGPSGSGKTRLTQHWMQNSDAMPENHWDQLVLGNNFAKSHGHTRAFWEGTPENPHIGWTPSQPTLIVIDYLHIYREALDSIIRRCGDLHENRDLKHPVRILLIDHVFPDDLKDVPIDKRLGAKQDKITTDITVPCFKHVPLALQGNYSYNADGTTQTIDDAKLDQLIPQILDDTAGDKVSQEKKDQACAYLRETTAAYYPLFAVLLGYTLRTYPDAEFSSWSRRKLIENYFEKTQRLRWLYDVEAAHWSAVCVATSTARRDIPYSLLTDCMRDEYGIPLINHDEVKEYCRAIIGTSTSDNILRPYEPDMMGETFFLLFLKALTSGQDNLRSLTPYFFQMLSCGEKDIQRKSAEEFIGFITRLVRNFCNDDQIEGKVQQHWDALLFLLNPSHFSDGTHILHDSERRPAIR